MGGNEKLAPFLGEYDLAATNLVADLAVAIGDFTGGDGGGDAGAKALAIEGRPSAFGLEGVWRDGVFTLETIVELACHAPAQLFGIHVRGFLGEGHWADIVLVDPHSETNVTPDTLQSKCGWSPFDSQSFRSRIAATIVSGQVAYRDDQVRDQVRGHQVVFAKERH